MTYIYHVLTFLVLCVFIRSASGGTLTEGKALHTYLLTDYNKDLRPITDQSQQLSVTISFYIRSIQELNELTEEFFFTGAFQLVWNDNSLTWNPSTYGNIYHTYISYESVWVPELILLTTSDDSDTYAKKWQRVRYTFNGEASFIVGGRIKATCGVNVEKYPFDKQVCKLLFQAWGYDSSDIAYNVILQSALTHQYTENAQWVLEKTELNTTVIDGWAALEVYFYLNRRSSFTIISFVAPLLLMSVLNLFVFILVPESGERVSYSVTVLLAIAVFMTIVSDNLPSSSQPVPIITYKLMVDLIISVTITLVTIFNLGIYHKNEQTQPVPVWIRAMYSCCCCKRNKGNLVFATRIDVGPNASAKSRAVNRRQDNVLKTVEPEVTWKNISAVIDYVSLVIFASASIISFVVYMVKVAG